MKNLILTNGKLIFEKRQKNILSAAIVLMVMILASAFLGLIRDRLLAGIFFRGNLIWQLDVYFASFRIPDMIFQVLIMSTLSAAFIPVFSEQLVKDEKKAYHIASSIINILLLLYLLLGAIVFILAKPISILITNYRGEELSLMVNLLRIILLSQSFFIFSNFLTGILQSNQIFLLPATASFLYNFGLILGIIFFTPLFGIYGPVVGVVIGSFLHLIVQFPLVRKIGFNHKLIVDFKDEGVRKIFKLVIPRSLSFFLDQLKLSVDVFIATSLIAGSLSVFNFAQHLSGLPVGLFGLTIGQAALPSLAKEVNNKENFKTLFQSSLNQILFLSLPVGIIILVLRIPAVRLAFGAKAFPWEATITTGKVVGILSLSIFAQAITELLIRVFYSFQDTKTPLLIRGLTVIVNISLSLWLTFGLKLGIYGLATGISIASLFQAILLLIFLNQRMGVFKRDFISPIMKMILATFFSALALWGPMRFLDAYILDTTKTINLIILTVIVILFGGAVYLLFSYLFKVKELESFSSVLKRFGQWKQILSQSKEVLDEG